MQWITENWLTLLLVGGMLAMHLFGHGHGSHGRKRAKDRAQPDEDRTGDDDDRKL